MPIILLNWRDQKTPDLSQSDLSWQALDEDAPLPADTGQTSSLLLPFDRFMADPQACLDTGHTLAVELHADHDPSRLQNWLPELAQIHINFAAFNDGRGFSQAQILRRRFRFTRRIIATGAILRDQIDFMVRCGFDGFEIETPFDLDALTEIPLTYQPDALGRPTILHARHPSTCHQESV